jgi:formylglycine-generating enzyme required for sulfatase activity
VTGSQGLQEQDWPDGSRLVCVPAGPALLGTADEETLAAVERDTPWYDVRRIEAPRVETSVPTFLLARFPVTCAQYAQFLNEAGAALVDGCADLAGVPLAVDIPSWLADRDPREAPHGVGVRYEEMTGWLPSEHDDGLPVTLVTWFGARAYAEYYGARLPLEVEWEKAARGDDGRRFPWGDGYVTGRANLADRWAGSSIDTQAQWDSLFSDCGTGVAWLASRPNVEGAFAGGRSPYGIEDMIGNVAEWCEDTYDASAEGGRDDFRAMRGAGRYGYTAIARCATRRRRAPESSGENLGFRIAAEPGDRGPAT